MELIMKRGYEAVMLLLVLLTITTIWTDQSYHSIINWIVWGIFVADFLIRLFIVKEKWLFLKKNPFLIIAIIPFDQFFFKLHESSE